MKKKIEVSKNLSSGAEKVERIAEKPTKSSEKESKKITMEEVALGTGENAVVKKVTEKEAEKAEKEKKAAKTRVEKALEKQKRKEKAQTARLEKRARRKQAFEARRKALLEEIKAEEKRLEEKRAARRRERAHAKANNRQRKNRQKRDDREKNKRRENNGGWIAAVVALGVTSLALGATVTVGAVEMNKANRGMMAGHRATMYELTGLMENVDNDLDRIRVSQSPAQQARILTDLLVQTRIAETDLEKMPISAEKNENITSFLNSTADFCEKMLSKLRNDGSLSEKDREYLAHLYEVNHSVREQLSELVSSMTDKDFSQFMKKGKGKLSDAIDKIEQTTMPENRMTFADKEKAEGACMERAPKPEEGHIRPTDAEELCKRYFSQYKIKDFQCIGETVNKGYTAYNVQGYDDKGTLLFAELSQQNGALLRFDYYEDCMEEKFNLEQAEDIAEEFLEKLGYDDMEAVRARKNGSNVDFTFVYEEEDVAYYPDEIRVKVCRERGVVMGMDATKYIQNHKKRGEVEPKYNLAQAYDKLYKGLDVETSRLVVVKTERGERPAYEFLCARGEDKYLVYLDAENGNEISIVNINTLQ